MKDSKLKHNLKKLKIDLLPNPIWRKSIRNEVVQFVVENPKGNKQNLLLFIQPKLALITRYSLAFILALALIFAPTGVIFAQKSTPGQKLYPVKRFVEKTRILLARDDKAKKALIQQFTLRRIEELEQTAIQEDEEKMDKALVETNKSIWEVLNLPANADRQVTLSIIRKKIARFESKHFSPAERNTIKKINILLKNALPNHQPSKKPGVLSTPIPTNHIEVQGISTPIQIQPTIYPLAPQSNISPHQLHNSLPTSSPVPSPITTPISSPESTLQPRKRIEYGAHDVLEKDVKTTTSSSNLRKL